MTDDRYKKIMADLGMPNSRSLLQALQQVANEVEQKVRADLAATAPGDTFYGLTLDQAKANLAVLGADDLRGLVVSLLIQQRIAERAFAATQPAPAEPVAKSCEWTTCPTRVGNVCCNDRAA